MTLSREWLIRILVIVALATIVALPFELRTAQQPAFKADDTVIIITPHNETIRSEFSAAFQEWYRRRNNGRTIAVDWRVIGGTTEIARYLQGEYNNSFKLHWTRDLQREWSNEVQNNFDNGRVALDSTPGDDTEAQKARRTFLASDVSCGIDLFFGGGSYDFIQQANAGRLVDSGVFQRHPGWFSNDVIPETHNGERFWAKDHTWVGAVLSSFGFLYNEDSLRRLGIERPPDDWRDLTDVRLRGELALADPTKSGSIAKAFEMVIQQEMQMRLRDLIAAGVPPADADKRAVSEGWLAAMRLIQRMGANARYFTDTSQKPPIDVGQGDAAVGMCIDFYGRYQAGAITRRGGGERLKFVTPPGGSVYSVDPIAMMRGAPHPQPALAFIEFVLSPDGQKLWNTRVGESGGPQKFALRRLPVRKDSYSPAARASRSDPDVEPYSGENNFIYNPAWTGPLLSDISFVIRVMCLDSHEELVDAWRAVIDAGEPPEAVAELQQLSSVGYETMMTRIHPVVAAKQPLAIIQLGKEISAEFRAHYAKAAEIARAAKR